jgi:NAD(P)-dependent dehydrogenase (short-subunit alcohol dehydrogenase family)
VEFGIKKLKNKVEKVDEVMKRLEGKVAIVTGASSGLNRAIAIGYAKEGAKVVIADLRQESNEDGYEVNKDISTDEFIRKNGGEAIYVTCDVSKSAQVKNVVDKAVETFGHLDIIVNGAGITTGFGGLHEVSDEAFDLSMEVNAKGCWNGCKHAIAQFLKQGTGGKVINIASVGGVVGLWGKPAYCASKGAIVNMTRQAAADYAKAGININAICPGAFPTAMTKIGHETPGKYEMTLAAHPIGRWGKVEELVGPAIFLASDESSFVCGVILPVDGGSLAV